MIRVGHRQNDLLQNNVHVGIHIHPVLLFLTAAVSLPPKGTLTITRSKPLNRRLEITTTQECGPIIAAHFPFLCVFRYPDMLGCYSPNTRAGLRTQNNHENLKSNHNAPPLHNPILAVCFPSTTHQELSPLRLLHQFKTTCLESPRPKSLLSHGGVTCSLESMPS